MRLYNIGNYVEAPTVGNMTSNFEAPKLGSPGPDVKHGRYWEEETRQRFQVHLGAQQTT